MRLSCGGHKDRVDVEHPVVLQSDPRELASVREDPRHRRRFEPDSARAQSGRRPVVELPGAGGEEHQVVAPLPHELRLVHRHGCRTQHRESLPPHLPPVAVRAVQHAHTPLLTQARQIGQLVRLAGGHHDRPRGCLPITREPDGEGAGGGGVVVVKYSCRRPLANLDTVPTHFLAAAAQQLGRVEAVVAQRPVHVGGEAVAGLTGVHHQDAAARPAQHERGRQSRCATADHDRVPGRGGAGGAGIEEGLGFGVLGHEPSALGSCV